MKKALFTHFSHQKERQDKDSEETTQEEGVQTFDQQLTAITFAILEAVVILLHRFIMPATRVRDGDNVRWRFLSERHRFLVVTKVTVIIGVQFTEF